MSSSRAAAVLVPASCASRSTKATADITLLRSLDAPFAEETDGRIRNQVRVRIANRSGEARSYRLTVTGAEQGQVVIPINPFPVRHNHTETTSLFVLLPRDAFVAGQHQIQLTISDGNDFSQDLTYQLLGPSAGSPQPTSK